MRFSNFEIERAYSEYLDSLEDWPPPKDELSAEMAAAMRSTDLDELNTRKTSPPGPTHL